MTFLEFADNHAVLVVFGAVIISAVVTMGAVVIIAMLCDFNIKRRE